VGHKGEKYRDIILLNTAREPLYEYLQKGKRARESHYVFTSQRETLPVPEGELDGWRLGEAAIHEWFKQLKATATEAEAPFIRDVTFHDLRHDFAHRAKKEAGLDDGELAVYLGLCWLLGTSVQKKGNLRAIYWSHSACRREAAKVESESNHVFHTLVGTFLSSQRRSLCSMFSSLSGNG
jgi:hypothetical protein